MDGMKLSFPPESPPLSVIVALSLSASPVTIDSTAAATTVPSFVFSDGRKLSGTTVLLRYVGRSANTLPDFYGHDAFDSSQIDEWVDYASVFSSGSEFENACGRVDKYLDGNTFLVGNSLTIADVALWSALAGTGQRWESLRKSKKYHSLVRWFNSILDEYSELLNKVLATYVKKGSGKPVAPPKSKDSQQATKSDAQDKGKPEVDLPEAEIGKVRLWFAPEPSGYLHIGHVKAALLNKYFAERYQGEVIVRFDDTNPAKESNEFVEKLMRDGKAYVDDTPREQMQKERRMDGIHSRCRNHGVNENLKLWQEMIAGSDRGLQCCVRGKFNMQDPNKAMRDPAYYRCNLYNKYENDKLELIKIPKTS